MHEQHTNTNLVSIIEIQLEWKLWQLTRRFDNTPVKVPNISWETDSRDPIESMHARIEFSGRIVPVRGRDPSLVLIRTRTKKLSQYNGQLWMNKGKTDLANVGLDFLPRPAVVSCNARITIVII
jgi:hypothetical protein